MKSSFRRLFPLLVALVMTVEPISNAEDSAAQTQQQSQAAAGWLEAAGPPPALKVPQSAAEWATQRDEIRKTLAHLLGDLPPRPARPKVTILSREAKDGYSQEKFEFDNGAGETVRGYCFVPELATPQKKSPAILYCHWHGGQYDNGKEEMLQTKEVPPAPGPTLAKRGYVVLGIDAYCFGERHGTGPDGPEQLKQAGELTAAKFNFWFGRSLWGMMIRDDLMALDYLCSRPEVDAARIGVTGMSMGSTRSWWIMAMDDRPKTAVCVACMTRYEELIREGQIKAHGIYYFVPGMLKHFDSEAVIALAAPRPMLFMTGDQDAGSPIAGVRKIGEIVSQVYAAQGAEAGKQFVNEIYPGVAHEYLPEMWQKTQEWFDRWLK